jgi:hypothetical protein
MPEVGNWGSLVRYFWNAGAVVQVWFNGIVLAGSMALRRDCIERTKLLEAWSQALSVDATVYRALRQHNYRVEFAPGVILVNSEHISLGSFRSWVRRQLVAAKNCSDGWAVVMVHGIYLAMTQLFAAGLMIAGWATANRTVLAVTAAALAIYWTVSIFFVISLELGMRRIARLNAQPSTWLCMPTLLKFIPAMALTHFVYAVDLVCACFCRRVSWRGVHYAILGKNKVKMVSYRPYRVQPAPASLSSVV